MPSSNKKGKLSVLWHRNTIKDSAAKLYYYLKTPVFETLMQNIFCEIQSLKTFTACTADYFYTTLT